MKEVTKHYFVSSQIVPSDIELLKEQGFESIVCNRPDGEEPNQPDFKSIEEECSKLGIKFYNYPLSPGDLNLERVLETKAIIEEDKKTLAYCRTGTRCITLWACAEVANKEVKEILKISENAGYDLNHMEEILSSLKAAS
tara:strand:- start:617 stop:1036 length:420 start_codon:yes stop_codon:yes gene_type:complete